MPMKALIVEFRIKPDFIEAFHAAIVENARASRDTEPGCRQFDVCRDPATPGLFFLYELYDDDAAIDAHVRSAHYKHMDSSTTSWVEKKTVWRYERVAP